MCPYSSDASEWLERSFAWAAPLQRRTNGLTEGERYELERVDRTDHDGMLPYLPENIASPPLVELRWHSISCACEPCIKSDGYLSAEGIGMYRIRPRFDLSRRDRKPRRPREIESWRV